VQLCKETHDEAASLVVASTTSGMSAVPGDIKAEAVLPHAEAGIGRAHLGFQSTVGRPPNVEPHPVVTGK
jgi:hypothetical protein